MRKGSPISNIQNVSNIQNISIILNISNIQSISNIRNISTIKNISNIWNISKFSNTRKFLAYWPAFSRTRKGPSGPCAKIVRHWVQGRVFRALEKKQSVTGCREEPFGPLSKNSPSRDANEALIVRFQNLGIFQKFRIFKYLEYQKKSALSGAFFLRPLRRNSF